MSQSGSPGLGKKLQLGKKKASFEKVSLIVSCHTQVPDSIEVVRNILSELEADAEDQPQTEEEEEEEEEEEDEEVEDVEEECTCLQVSNKVIAKSCYLKS